MYISPIQLLSIATSLVPFLEHNDANRVLMGANMQRQAVPLLYPQKPLVGTGMEFLVAYDSGMIVKSYNEGYVDYSSSEKIVLEDKNHQFLTYKLLKYTRTNSDTCINQKPLVWPGEKVYAGQIIADGPSILEGELSLGRNLNLAYMTWEGYNFEDAVIISERVVIDDLLTSINIETYETEIYDTEFGAEVLTNEISGLSVSNKKLLTANGIIKEGSYVKEGDVLIGKLTPQKVEETGESKLYEAVFGKKLESPYLESSLRLSKGSEGRVIDVRIIDKNRMIDEEEIFEDSSPLANSIIRVYIAQIRKIETGDKVSGRHGNKGIISKILPVQDMPYLPDGTPIDIIFNPLGIPSRMNIGQIFECLLGFAAEKLNSRFKVIPFDESFGKDISRNLVNQKLKEASIKSSLDWVFNEYSPGKILLTDGRTGEIFDNPVLVGKSYILKLFHLVEDKIHARATGPYSLIHQQPLGGRSSKGGQRFGEMEVWALQAYGAAYTLQELLTIKSDDIEGRDYTYQALTKDRIPAIPKVPESFNMLTKQLQALGLDLTTYKINLNPYDKTKELIQEKTILSAFEKELQIKIENSDLDSPQRIIKELSKTDLKNKLITEYDKKTIQDFNNIKKFLKTKK
jgi:DNA-directed RNA polymerase subunit beta